MAGAARTATTIRRPRSQSVHEGGQLEAERFASTGGPCDDSILPSEQCFHDLALPTVHVAVAEAALKDIRKRRRGAYASEGEARQPARAADCEVCARAVPCADVGRGRWDVGCGIWDVAVPRTQTRRNEVCMAARYHDGPCEIIFLVPPVESRR